jgi:hypothetical protein
VASAVPFVPGLEIGLGLIVSNKVGESKMTSERLKYLERLRGLATITWRNDELKKAYEQALAARQQALAG